MHEYLENFQMPGCGIFAICLHILENPHISKFLLESDGLFEISEIS